LTLSSRVRAAAVCVYSIIVTLLFIYFIPTQWWSENTFRTATRVFRNNNIIPMLLLLCRARAHDDATAVARRVLYTRNYYYIIYIAAEGFLLSGDERVRSRKSRLYRNNIHTNA